MSRPTLVTATSQRSLRRFIIFDQATCGAAVGAILAVNTWLHPSPYLLLLAVVVGLAAAVMGLGRRRLAAGDLKGAVLWVAGANWGVSLVATTVATFSVPITVVAAMLPSVLAVPYVDSRSLTRISRISMAVSMLAVTLGVTQDFSGLSDDLPSWIRPAVLLAFVPFITGLVVMVSTHNSARLTRALTEALEANERLRDSEAALLESRTRVVAATDRERRRIARDLHDGAQQHLISMAMRLQRVRRLLGTEPASAAATLDLLARDLKDATASLRDLAHGVYPPVLTDRGLCEALTELAARAPCTCAVEIGWLPGCAEEVEASVYWCCVEALQNVAKHAGENARARLQVAAGEAGNLVFAIEDDGPGFDPATVQRGHGLTNMADRVGAVGGELVVWSAPGCGVRVSGVVPTRDDSELEKGLSPGAAGCSRGEADEETAAAVRRFGTANQAVRGAGLSEGASAPLAGPSAAVRVGGDGHLARH